MPRRSGRVGTALGGAGVGSERQADRHAQGWACGDGGHASAPARPPSSACLRLPGKALATSPVHVGVVHARDLAIRPSVVGTRRRRF
ncbi:MAG: hypothetical protein MZV64_17760 [Ignavibacteriales bacterium]|nr:hypothetical protein [Ignavibacteriales bacterium]